MPNGRYQPRQTEPLMHTKTDPHSKRMHTRSPAAILDQHDTSFISVKNPGMDRENTNVQTKNSSLEIHAEQVSVENTDIQCTHARTADDVYRNGIHTQQPTNAPLIIETGFEVQVHNTEQKIEVV